MSDKSHAFTVLTKLLVNMATQPTGDVGFRVRNAVIGMRAELPLAIEDFRGEGVSDALAVVTKIACVDWYAGVEQACTEPEYMELVEDLGVLVRRAGGESPKPFEPFWSHKEHQVAQVIGHSHPDLPEPSPDYDSAKSFLL